MRTSLYDTLVELSSRLADVDLLDEVGHDCIDDANALLERIRPTLNSVRGLELQKCSVPIRYEPDFFSSHTSDFQNLNKLASAFRFAADVDFFRGYYEAGAQNGICILDLANAFRRGGIVVDQLVSVAVSGYGVACLRSVRERFPDAVRCDLIGKLQRYELERESLCTIKERDAKWLATSGYEEDGGKLSEDELIDRDSELSVAEQRAMIQMVNEFGNRPESEMQVIQDGQDRRALASTRLLVVDLAIRCWEHANGRYPSSLNDLVPAILVDVPRDPFTDEDFIYVPSNDSFLLYSTGPDKRDTGGNFGSWLAVSNGGYDLCLDSEEYWPECGINHRRPSRLRRLWKCLWSGWRDKRFAADLTDS